MSSAAGKPSFPLVALLPDLWTVYRGDVAVSQHASLALALRQVHALDAACGQRGAHGVQTPDHSPVVIAQAKAAIAKARRQARESDSHAMYVTCAHCQLWHHMDSDCPPVRSGWAGFDGSQEP